jgi:hypothetical protein
MEKLEEIETKEAVRFEKSEAFRQTFLDEYKKTQQRKAEREESKIALFDRLVRAIKKVGARSEKTVKRKKDNKRKRLSDSSDDSD